MLYYSTQTNPNTHTRKGTHDKTFDLSFYNKIEKSYFSFDPNIFLCGKVGLHIFFMVSSHIVCVPNLYSISTIQKFLATFLHCYSILVVLLRKEFKQ